MVKSGIWVEIVSEERSRNTFNKADYSTSASIKEIGELQEDDQQDYQQKGQLLSKSSDKMGHLSTINLVDKNNVIDDKNVDEKIILNNNNNNIHGNGVMNNLKMNNSEVLSTFPSDQNNNNNKKDLIVMDKSKLNVVCNESINNTNSSVIYGSDDEKLLKRKNLNEKVYEDWKGDKIFGIQFKAPLKWDKIIAISLLHLAFLYCAFTYKNNDWRTTLWAILCGGFAGFGVTAGAHRLWTHRAYKANTILRILLIMCFSLSGQNTLYDWVRDHRVHHKFSETDADPHNSHRGFFFAHVGWLMMYKHPEVIRRGRQMDMSDILSDPVVQFHQKHFVIMKILFCFILPLIPPLLWGDTLYNAFVTQCIFRYVFCLNATWSVNSAAHLWGTRPYDRKINPAENLIVSIAAFGEGWHNYHHVFPWDYKAAELGNYSVNLSTMFIDMFALIGWAYDMKQPSKELIKRTIEKCGDGTHAEFGHHLSEVPMPEDDGDLVDENLNNCYEDQKTK